MTKKRINLLSPEEQQQNRLVEINYQVIRLGFTLTSTFVILGVVLFGSTLVFGDILEQTEAQITSHNQVLTRFQQAGLEDQIIELNETMRNFNTLTTAQTKWSPYLVELAQALPDDVSINTLKIDAATGKVEAAGSARSRNSVLQLRENIQLSEYFENINFPLSNLETPADVAWKYRFYLKGHDQ